jgi:hypothetical protein
MKTTNQTNMPTASDVLYELSIALDEGTRPGDILDDFIRHFPKYSAELTEYAIDAAIYALRPEPSAAKLDCAPASEKLSPAVSRGISRFQNRLHALRREAPSAIDAKKRTVTTDFNPFASLDKKSFRALATSLRANNVLVAKLRDRLIDSKTINVGFVQRLSELMATPIQVIADHLNGSAQVSFSNQFYKSEEKPHAPAQQTFEEAVRGAGLSKEDEAYLLGL